MILLERIALALTNPLTLTALSSALVGAGVRAWWARRGEPSEYKRGFIDGQLHASAVRQMPPDPNEPVSYWQVQEPKP